MVYTYLAAAAETSGFDLGEALRNTVVGMGTVFLVLILLSGLIALFRFIPNTDKKPAAKPAPVKPAPVVTPAAPEPVQDDTQLIAVITAAIAASMGTTSTNGFVVRSVRRVSDSHWKKS